MVIHGVGWKRVVRAQMIHNAILGNTTKLFYFNYSNMTTITYPNSKFVFTDENGNTGTTILPESITTPSITVSSIVDSTGSTGASGYVLSSTGDGIAWIPQSDSSTGTSDLNMNNNDITNVNTLTTTNVSATNLNISTFTNQVTFNTQPTCSVLPTESNHLVTKEYVDNTFSNFNSSNLPYNLYLNLSQPRTVIGLTGYSGFTGSIGITGYTLSTTMTTAPSGSTGPRINFSIPTASISTLFATFISDPINITSIPQSLWQMKLYAGLSSTSGTFYFTFTLELYRSNTYINIGNSSDTSSIEDFSTTPTTNPSIFLLNLRVLPVITLPTDRLVLKIYYFCSSITPTVSTYFENNYYSHLNVLFDNNPSQITGISTITSSNNMTISAPNNSLTIGSTASTTSINIGSTGNIYLFTQNSNGLININKPIVPLYRTFPTVGQIGNVISIASPTPILFPVGLSGSQTQTIEIATYPIPYRGTYYTYASVGLNCTTASGTITFITLEILLGTLLLGKQDVVASLPSATGTNHVLPCTAIVYDDSLNTVKLRMTLSYTGAGAQYQTPDTSIFVWSFVRIS